MIKESWNYNPMPLRQQTLVKSLEVVNTISLKLQSESVASVQDLSDSLIELFDDFKQKLSPDAPLVASKDFEKAIIKLQNNIESTLTAAEATAVIHLQKVHDEPPSPDDSLVDILARAENSKRARLQQTQSMYHPVHHEQCC
jgi:hypothetical protein